MQTRSDQAAAAESFPGIFPYTRELVRRRVRAIAREMRRALSHADFRVPAFSSLAHGLCALSAGYTSFYIRGSGTRDELREKFSP